jgi:hypothetical protein
MQSYCLVNRVEHIFITGLSRVNKRARAVPSTAHTHSKPSGDVRRRFILSLLQPAVALRSDCCLRFQRARVCVSLLTCTDS